MDKIIESIYFYEEYPGDVCIRFDWEDAYTFQYYPYFFEFNRL